MQARNFTVPEASRPNHFSSNGWKANSVPQNRTVYNKTRSRQDVWSHFGDKLADYTTNIPGNCSVCACSANKQAIEKEQFRTHPLEWTDPSDVFMEKRDGPDVSIASFHCLNIIATSIKLRLTLIRPEGWMPPHVFKYCS